MRKSFTQKIASRFTCSKTSRGTAEVSAESSASVAEVSQSTHSAATSRNLRDLSVRLDDYLEQVGVAGDEVDLDVISLSRQIEKVKKYRNGSLPESVVPVEVDAKTLELVNIAAWSSKAVYAADTASMHRVVPVQDVSNFQPTEYSEQIDASFRDGTVKATRVQLFLNREGTDLSKLLVVAIRGSTSKRRDWTINFDDEGAGTEGTGFIDTNDCTYQVHGGFLECAKGMVEKIAEAISSILSKSDADGLKGDVQLLFSGHSAGGAVASLLAAHITSGNLSVLGELSGKFPSINCIVFGSPPVSTPALGTSNGASTFLSIINEGDPVPRMDKAYIGTLLIIYVSPMPGSSDAKELPAMTLENAGRVLLLKDHVQGLSSVVDDPDQKKVKGVLQTTIFGNPRAHKMDMYLWKLGIVKML
ncbi:lipase family protein [Aspergillus stella-maris]|uniref:lipase family protein n=1 Tax=Aspergillus stella-maris TaxID=1810926 RepID=UPI003CCCB3D7